MCTFWQCGTTQTPEHLSICIFATRQLAESQLHGVLQQFQVIENLTLMLVFQKDLIYGLQYMMGDITMLPQIMSLKLNVLNQSFGACCFHLLRMCTGLQRLAYIFIPQAVPNQ
jgi:hypothetical protein